MENTHTKENSDFLFYLGTLSSFGALFFVSNRALFYPLIILGIVFTALALRNKIKKSSENKVS